MSWKATAWAKGTWNQEMMKPLTGNAYRAAKLAWFGRMVDTYRQMSPPVKTELEDWEKVNLDGCAVGTSDWPGWLPLISPPPTVGAMAPAAQVIPRPASPKTPIPRALRWQIWERDNFTCRQCGSRRNLHVDHIIPEAAGGPTVEQNLQTLCVGCNGRKGARLMPFQTRL